MGISEAVEKGIEAYRGYYPDSYPTKVLMSPEDYRKLHEELHLQEETIVTLWALEIYVKDDVEITII